MQLVLNHQIGGIEPIRQPHALAGVVAIGRAVEALAIEHMGGLAEQLAAATFPRQ